MKMSMRRFLKQFVAIGVGATLVVGCAHTISLRVVDAKTCQPLEGVSVQWLQARYQMLEKLKQEGPTNLPPTGSDGTIKVKGLHHWWASEFIFSRSGYSNLYGYYDTRGLMLGGEVNYFPQGQLQDQFYLKGNVKTADKTNGFFIVEMQR
jgi:hypothetical protein